MKTVPTSSLYWQLWLIIALAVMPPLLIGVFEYQSNRTEATRETIRVVENMLVGASVAEEHAVNDIATLMRIMANASELREIDTKECSTLAQRLSQPLAGLSNLGAVLPDGTVFCSAKQTMQTVNVADRQWFAEASSTQGITHGEFVIERITGKPSVVFGMPLRDSDGELRAALFSSLGPHWFERLMARYYLPEGWEASLVSREGHLLSRYPKGETWPDRMIPPETLMPFLQVQGITDLPGLDGRHRLYGIARVTFAPDDLLVLIGAPLDQSLGAIDRRFASRALTLLFVVLLSGLLARMFARKLIEGWLERVRGTIREIARGDLDARVSPPSSIREFAMLEDGINQMAGQIGRREAELDKLSTAIKQSPESIVITDIDGRIEYVNEAFVRATGYSREEVLGKNPRILNRGKTSAAVYENLWQTLTRGEVWRGEFHNTRKDGTEYLEQATIAPIKQADGSISHYVAVKEDITLRRESEALLERMAYYDKLTGLANRSLLHDRLGRAVARSARSQSHGMLLMLDVDRFKLLNDSQGHEAGDTLLRGIAERLRRCVREEDTVARQGDDDFAVLIEHIGPQVDEALAHAERIVRKIEAQLAAPFDLRGDGNGYFVTLSIGITLFSGGSASAELVAQQAEVALDQAKRDGRNTCRFFSPQMQAAVKALAKLGNDLRAALEGSAFRLHYQPQVNAQGRVTGAEALIRWFDANGAPVPPSEFIPIAEETGLIIPIGQWVLTQACAQLAHWQAAPRSAHLTLAVNISPRQFLHPRFVEEVAAIISSSGIDPAGLKLELTESVFLRDPDQTVARMLELREIGVDLALDDFGTGFSSLSYLKNLPFDQLKIDQSFVHDMLVDGGSKSIVRAIISMSQSLELEVIAEGVETMAQRSALEALGCHLYQGYLFGKPVDISQWPEHWLQSCEPDETGS